MELINHKNHCVLRNIPPPQVDARLEEWAQSLRGTLKQHVSMEISAALDEHMTQIRADIAEKAAAIERTKEFLKKESYDVGGLLI